MFRIFGVRIDFDESAGAGNTRGWAQRLYRKKGAA
jgi:hypothetical protein